jgi:hypothetical protein
VVPSLYFVLDRSGSMSNLLSATDRAPKTFYDSDGKPFQDVPTAHTRFQGVRSTMLQMVASVGTHARVGATMFPVDDATCQPGGEVTPLAPNDATSGSLGLVGQALARATSKVPAGTAPVAETLRALLPKLSDLPKPASVILVTDGLPSCNASAECNPDDCLYHACAPQPASDTISDAGSDPKQAGPPNCCDPTYGPHAAEMCPDREPTKVAVRALHDAGVPTFVIAVNIDDAFFDQLARAGGTDVPYLVKQIDEMAAAFADIQHRTAVCEVAAERAPANPDQVTLVVGGHKVPFGSDDGWTWADPSTIRLNGPACTDMLARAAGALSAYEHCD